MLLRLGATRAPLVMTVIGGLGAGRDNQRVVFKHCAILQREPARFRVDIGSLPEQHARVLLFAENPAQWRAHLAGRERPRSDLVKQRLKEMEVPPVDKSHIDRGMLQRPSRVEPSKSPAENENPVPDAFRITKNRPGQGEQDEH